MVIGAGIGGILTAAVLARYLRKVTLFDRDNLAEASSPDAQPRKFVPQGTQVHIFSICFLNNMQFGVSQSHFLLGGGRRIGDHFSHALQGTMDRSKYSASI